MGPFIDAWLRVRGESADARRTCRRRFLDPLVAALDPCDVGHLPEITDAEAPHLARGCPFQAWSLGEIMRAEARLREGTPRRGARPREALVRGA